MPDFEAKAKSNDFIGEFLDNSTDPGKAAKWLFENANRMNEAMFFDPSSPWNQLESTDVLIIRAFAPDGVFTSTAKAGYLNSIGGIPYLAELVDDIFCDDYQFVTKLPAGSKNQLIQLVQMVYRQGIRVSDKRVKEM